MYKSIFLSIIISILFSFSIGTANNKQEFSNNAIRKPDHHIDGRGDLNLNGLEYELADAMLFIEYFLGGITIFENRHAQTFASDANRDDHPLDISDLVYMLNVIRGDQLPYKDVKSIDTAIVDIEHGMLSLFGIDIGGLFLTLKGMPRPQFQNLPMDVKYYYNQDTDVTRIIIYSLDGKCLKEGEFFRSNTNEILELQVATKEGRRVFIDGFSNASGTSEEISSIITIKNQFGISTGITFHHLKTQSIQLEIFNEHGERVYEVNNTYPPGKVEIYWDGNDSDGILGSSGVYIYKLITDDITKAGKIIIVK